jgi:SAM-dependent methyltransferase
VPFDVCVLSDVIEHARDPQAVVRTVRRMLKPDGTLFIATPSVAHWSARVLKRHWMEFKEEHLFYFDPLTIQRLLTNNGFAQVVVRPSWKRLNVDYVSEHFRRFHVPLIEPMVSGCRRLMPAAIRRRPFSVRTGGIIVLARPRIGTS